MKRGWLWQVLAPLVGVVVVLGGLIAVGRLASDWLRRQPQSQSAFADIECPTPPGRTRAEFLDEVQYLGTLPDQLPLLDEGLAARVTASFGRHPWVESVDGVSVVAPSQVRVQLTFRKPVLAVSGSPPRVVDGKGVVLPATAPADGLLRLTLPDASAPASGVVWQEAAGAAQIAAVLLPHQSDLGLESIEVRDGDMILGASPSVRVHWGRPPGAEKEGEADASVKLAHLLKFVVRHGELRGEIDVRSKTQPRP